MNHAEVLSAIAGGASDGKTDDLYRAIKARVKVVGDINASSIDIGDRVRLTNISPKYLNGLPGTVLTRGNGRFDIKIDEGHDTGRYGSVDNVLQGVRGTMLEAV